MIVGVLLALSLWPFGGHTRSSGPPPPPPVVLPSPAEMHAIAVSALTYVKLEDREVGMPGLISDVKTCYGALGPRPSPSKAAYCIILDTAAGKIADPGGETFAPDYFKDDTRSARELRLEERVTPSDLRRVFVQEMDEAELQAEDAS